MMSEEWMKPTRIIQHPDPRLREVSSPVGSAVEEMKFAIQQLESNLFTSGGHGLSAPQIGTNKRIISLSTPCEYSPRNSHAVRFATMIDPIIDKVGKATWRSKEGCLSIPGDELEVERFTEIFVIWNDPYGVRYKQRYEGMEAAVIQHEIDHLNGKLIIDYQKEKSE